jgi:hypothetical protein
MGVEIKEMKRFILKAWCVSDGSYHQEKKWISEEESKKFYTNEIWSFIEISRN